MRRLIAVIAVSGVLAGLGVAGAAATPPESGTYDYVVRRNGDPIGTHRVEVRARGDRMAIRHDLRIEVRIAGWEAYSYRLSSAEFWDDGRLTRLTAHTNKNGTPLRVLARVEGNRLRIDGSNAGRAPLDAVPASPAWDVLGRRPAKMIDAESGEVLDVRVGAARDRTVRARGREERARCYGVTGGLDATLCYGSDGVLVRKRLQAPDGSTIEEVLR